jgi:hypothetical protein
MHNSEKCRQFKALRKILSVSGLICIGAALVLYLLKPEIVNLPLIAVAVLAVGVVDEFIANVLVAHKIHQLERDGE